MASKSGSGAEAKTSASSSSALSRATGEGKTGHDVGAGGEGAHRFVEDEEEEDENDVDFRSGDLGDEVYCVYDDDEAWPAASAGMKSSWLSSFSMPSSAVSVMRWCACSGSLHRW